MNPMNETLKEFMKVEHHRLHCAEQWADSPYKEAVLASIHSALERLEADAIQPFQPPACMVCASRMVEARVLPFPSKPKRATAILQPAA
jgi:hypothetical protein